MKTARGMLVLNVATNVIAIGVQISISLALAPYLIGKLGVAAYGMVALANTFPSYVRMFTGAISNSVFRYVALGHNREDWESANEYFNTSIKALLLVNVPLLAVSVFIALNCPSIFNTPAGLEWQSSMLAFFILLSSLAGTSTAVLQVPYALAHKFYLQNILLVVARLMSLVVMVSCFYFLGPQLLFVGIYQFCFQVAAGLLLFFFQLGFQKNLRVRRKLFSMAKLKELLGFGKWVFVNDMAVLMYLGAGIFIVNKVLGATETGRFGPIMLLNALLILMGGALGKVLMPIFYSFIAKNDLPLLTQRVMQATQILAYLSGFIVLIYCGLSRQILEIWVGADFVYLWPLIWMTVFATWAGGICYIPSNHVYRGLNHVKPVAIWNFMFGVIHVVTTLVLIIGFDLGLWGFGLSYMINFGIKSIFMNAYFTGEVLQQPKLQFGGIVVGTLIKVLLLATILFYVSNQFETGLKNMVICIAVAASIYLAISPLMIKIQDVNHLLRLLGIRQFARR